MKSKYSWTEIAILLAIVLILGRYIWAKELIDAENSLIEAMGIPAYFKYFLTVPLALFVYYGIYKGEARSNGKPIVGKPVTIFSIAGLSIAIIYLGFFV